jgi:23S rRNA pseudouridine2605 synthase
MHPRYEVEKVYLATLERGLSADEMDQLKQGLRSDGDVLRVDSVEARPSDDYPSYEIRVHEGKNRHIRRMFEVLEVGVRRLKRIRFGPLTVKGIAKGMFRALTDEELKSLDL